MSRRSTISLLSLALVASACASGPSAPSTSTTRASTTTTLGETTTSEPTGDNEDRGPLHAQIDELIAVTEDVRELRFLEPPTVTIVTDEELAARVREQLEEELDPNDLARDTALQVVLGLIEPDVDLFELYTDLYSEQVAGYYDGELEEMVVPAGDELNALQRVTLVHELTHALTDQHFDFDTRIETLDAEDRFDELSALQAVIEGDASFTELLYVSELPVGEQLAIVEASLDQDTTVFDRTPRFLQDLLLFPYLEGSTFVQSLWSADTGFDLVNEAYQQPPTTTEQISNADVYARREPARLVELPTTTLEGYDAEEEGVWGELSFRVMLDQGLGAAAAGPAVTGWGGDRYRVLFDGSDVVYVLVYEGDRTTDAAEMYDALAAYAISQMDVGEPEVAEGRALLNGDDFAYVALKGDRVLFIAASDPAVGPAVVEMAAGF